MKKKNLMESNLKVAKEWHTTKNGDLKPTDVTANSNKKVWWRCKEGHEWKARINSRNQGNGCPYCAGRLPIVGKTDLATVNPELAKEWHTTKNRNLKPTDVTCHSHKKVWWLCQECGHEWRNTISKRSLGSCCKICTKER